jgi:transmembrane sensor
VSAGEQTTAADAGIEAAVRSPDPAAATSWQTGRLAFRLEPLRYVLEDVNRYATKPIVAGDEEVASLRITGTVAGDNVEGWIASLQSVFGIQAVEERDRVVLRRK